MPVIAQRLFKGVRPRSNPRLLSTEEATVAVNTKLWSGKPRAFMRPKFEFEAVKAGPILSIFKYRGGDKEGWFHWASDVDVVKGPLAGDDHGRVYYTGDGVPKLTDSTMAVAPVRNATANALAGDSLITIEGPTAPHQVGDPLRLDYDGSTLQDVTVTSVAPSGSSIVVGINPPLTGNFDSGRPVTNLAQRYPLHSFDLGVPSPATALTTTPNAGAGVTTGTINAVSDIVLYETSVPRESTIGDVQDGNAPALDNHLVGEDFQVVATGEPMEFELSTDFSMRIFHSNETRDMNYRVVLNPGPSETNLFATNNRIVRPAGIGSSRTGGNEPFLDWVYTVTCTGVHTPTPGTYSYGGRISPIAGIAGDDNNSWGIWWTTRIRVRLMTRIRLTLNTGHGLESGDRITLHIEHTADTPADRQLEGRTVEIIEVDGDDVIIAALPGGTYNVSGATWTQSTDVDEELVSRTYVYTYVAAIAGQEFEGGPSPASPVIEVTDGQPVALTGFIDPTSPLLRNTNFTALRVYRFQPDESGGGAFLFLVELPVTTTTYQDTILAASLGETLTTTGYELPPDNLTGLIELPEGGAAGFTDKELCFAVPYQLHAYPAAYRRTTHDRIVALIAFGSSIAACTEGTPYVFTGTDPLEMTSERLEIIQPCMSKRGAVDIGYAGIYPSPEGLMLISVGRADVVTLDWFTSDEWKLLNPSSFVATRYGQRYMCFYDATSVYWPPGKFTDALERRGGFIFDPKEGTFVFLDLWASEAWTDPTDDAVYLVQGDEIRKWDASRMELTWRWRSRPYHSLTPVGMAVGLIEAEKYPVRFTAIADGAVKHTQLVTSRQSFRLPDGEHNSWAFQVESEHQVDTVYMASSMDELRDQLGRAA